MDNLATPSGTLAVIAFGAALVRLVLGLLDSPILGRALQKLPPEVRPFVPLLLSAALAVLDHLAGGGDVGRAVMVALGAFTGSEVTHRVQKQRAARISKGSIRLGG